MEKLGDEFLPSKQHCATAGHSIILFNPAIGKLSCSKCGLTLDEIREREGLPAEKPKP